MHATKEGLRHFIKTPHWTEEIREVVLDLDGGGERRWHDNTLPATWAVVISTVSVDRSRAFYGHFAGEVCTDRDDGRCIGADKQTSMTAEISAQAFAAMYTLSNDMQLQPDTLFTVVYGNEIAAKFARSVAKANTNQHLAAVTASLWQIAAMRRNIRWVHSFSHSCEPLNELADTIVEHAAKHQEIRHGNHHPCSTWVSRYSIAQAKLIYLACLPAEYRDAYPEISGDGKAIAATPLNEVKLGLPAQMIGAGIDQMKSGPGRDQAWEAEVVTLATHNLCSARSDGARASLDMQFTDHRLTMVGTQENRDRLSFTTIYEERWWIGGSAGDRAGNYGCQVWISLTLPWAVQGEKVIIPNPKDIGVFIAELRLLIVRMALPIYSCLVCSAHGPHSGRPRK